MKQIMSNNVFLQSSVGFVVFLCLLFSFSELLFFDSNALSSENREKQKCPSHWNSYIDIVEGNFFKKIGNQNRKIIFGNEKGKLYNCLNINIQNDEIIRQEIIVKSMLKARNSSGGRVDDILCHILENTSSLAPVDYIVILPSSRSIFEKSKCSKSLLNFIG